MDAPVFDESLRTGNDMIDSQHRSLFDLAARVTDKVGGCQTDVARDPITDDACFLRTDDAVADAVYGLIDYITEHFADEQQLMTDMGYPSAGVHAVYHEELSRRVSAFTMRFVNGDELAAQELVDFFCEWLTTHIQAHDRQFTGWLETTGQRPPAA